MRRTIGSCLTVAIACLSIGQQKTLDQFVGEHLDSLASGSPLVYLEGQRIKSEASSLGSFARKLVTIGALKAIVPVSMVHIDDSFSQLPNLYDGLELKTKVLYLLSTLNDEQMKSAVSKGIGLGDLSADQQKVFTSIVPKKFQVDKTEPDGGNRKVVDSFLLTDSQRSKVRLKFTKSIQLELMLANGTGYTNVDSMDYLGTETLSGYSRRTDEKMTGPGEIYGIKVRSIVPNEQKASDLDYTAPALKKGIKLSLPVAIRDVCIAIRQATNVSVIPDPHVSQRLLTLIGKEVQAGDLLKAIAQMVTGTYRRVGPDYVLTSDLMGLGTRKLRFYEWEEDIRKKVWSDESEWRSKIGKSSALDLIKMDPADPIQPNDSFKEYLAKNDVGALSGRAAVPNDAIDSVLREFVGRRNTQSPTQPVTEKGLVARSMLQLNFVLPTGQDVKEGDYNNRLGTFDEYRRQYGKPYEDKTPLIKKVEPDSNLAMTVRVSSLESAEMLLNKAKLIGFKEVWLETSEPTVLNGAVERGKALGLGVRLVIRPWRMTDSNALPDLTLLGHNADSLSSWIRGNSRLKPGSEPPGPYRAIPLFENALSPDVEPESWASFVKLGVTPGLLGVVVLDPQTSGYEQSQGTSRSVSSSVILPRHFGYSTSMRSAFLRQIGADPIDLVPTQCLSSVSVNPFFFADYELMGYPRDSRTETDEAVIAPFTEQWNSFKANKMMEGLKRLSSSILSKFKVPIWADLILNSSNRPMTDIIPVTAYRAIEGFEYDAGDAGIPFGAQYATPLSVRFIVDPALPETPNTEMMLKLMSQGDMRKKKFSICYDLSKLKVEDVTKFLDKWFEQRNP